MTKMPPLLPAAPGELKMPLRSALHTSVLSIPSSPHPCPSSSWFRISPCCVSHANVFSMAGFRMCFSAPKLLQNLIYTCWTDVRPLLDLYWTWPSLSPSVNCLTHRCKYTAVVKKLSLWKCIKLEIQFAVVHHTI